MWRILGLAIFCGLLSPLQGKCAGIQSAVNPETMTRVASELMLQDNFLQNYLQNMKIPSFPVSGLLSVLNTIISLKISSVEVSNLQMIPLPGIGAEFVSDLKLKHTGTALGLVPVPLTAVLNAKLRSKYKMVNFLADSFQLEVLECTFQVLSADIHLLGINLTPLMLTKIQDAFKTKLYPLACPAAKAFAELMKTKVLSMVNVDIALGSYGLIKYRLWSIPYVAAAYYGIYFKTEIVTQDGKLLSIPDVALPIKDPPIQTAQVCFGLHPAFLTIAQGVAFQLQPLEVTCVQDQFSHADELKSAIDTQFGVQGCSDDSSISSTELYLRLSLAEGPVCQFAAAGPSVRLSVQIKVFIRKPNGVECGLCAFKDKAVFDPVFAVAEGKLTAALTLNRHELILESTDPGTADIPVLEPLFAQLLSEALVPVLNGRLSVGLPLPPLFGVPVTGVQVALDSLVLCG